MIEIPRPRRRILLVDQDIDLRVGLGLMLTCADREVQHASNGAEAIAMHRRQPFDIIITEILMPETDGLEILLALGGEPVAPKFIFLSRQSCVPTEVLRRIAQHLGARHVISKPFPPDVLMATVREVLAEG